MTIDDQVTARDEAKRILNEAQSAIGHIEIAVDDLNSLMVELLWSHNLSEEAQDLANDLGGEANKLWGDLNKHFERLRREIAAADDDDDESEGGAS
jgi:hypothetical protein